MGSQNCNILKWMKSGKPINAIQALNHFGVFRLSARIHNLRCEGHDIVSVRHRRNNKNVVDYKLK